MSDYPRCRNEGCDNYCIADASLDPNECAQCRAEHDRDMAHYGKLYRAEQAQNAVMGEPCEKCGERGYMKHGDPDDCRSPDCMGSKCDAAELLMEDR